MSAHGPETREHRLKRLRLRSWRRGTREMDLILGPFADRHLATMDDAELDLFESLLDESDPRLYDWVSGREPPEARFSALVARLVPSAARR